MPSSGLNLSSVNEAFGEKADLYTDVLAIRPNASTDQIQQAYFTRRDELFHVLAQMDQRGVDANSQKRYHVERQMDGVVMALRVLGDPDARMRYDSIRDDRLGDGT
uniref:J domain-containing protein n=1 Tax=Entomoneis paludosa TaxID=265537 RepID=A0A7S2Y7N0_9STRA|mmetsp:Transcript_21354/g.44546  ORF Transcript_21354/g.44546 Transcript_21354/m.44546 type:complete len:106 (+) Transcript_21354:247-564(+)